MKEGALPHCEYEVRGNGNARAKDVLLVLGLLVHKVKPDVCVVGRVKGMLRAEL
jgi:hypothetical protein